MQKEAPATGQVRTVTQDNGTPYVTGSSAIGGLAGATNSVKLVDHVAIVSTVFMRSTAKTHTR
jgi:hypothetical protein